MAPRTPPPRRAAVWIADDDLVHGETCAAVLGDENDVTVFGGGPPLLQALAAGAPPDVVLLDWHMPDMTGPEVCRAIRLRADAAELPIVFLTGSASQENLLEGLEAGANEYLRKPYAAAELTARVRALVRAARLHASLARAEQELRNEAVVRERLVAILAHDLRQPLSAISLGLQVVDRRGADTVTIQRLLGAANRMTRMVEQLLDVSRSRTAAGIPVQPEPMDLATVATRVVDELRLAHPLRSIALRTAGDCGGVWDADRMAQVCSNLVGNALLHGASDAPVEVDVDGTGPGVTLTVDNAGTPIPAEALGTLFDELTRARPEARGGLGLGLYITDQIVRAHGGSVSASSDATRTRFVARLPRAPRPQPPQTA